MRVPGTAAAQMPDPDQAQDLAEFIEALGLLRAWAGSPSYRTFAKQVGALMRPPQHVSPSTLVDIFKTGRRRLDLDLVLAIVRALGVEEPEVARWRNACVRAHVNAKAVGTGSVLRQLPADLESFAGRDRELAGLLAACTPARAARSTTVVITAIEGMGGVGKTRLALRAAHQLVRSGRFGEMQLYADLRGFDPEHPPTDPTEVLETFLRQLGLAPSQIPDRLEERAAMFRDRMEGKDALVLLDNAADADQVRGLIPASPCCLVLVTSRRSLADLEGASVHTLDVFSTQEALELFSLVVGAERVEAERADAVRLAEACGHLPLAVSIVAARLRARPAWSLAEMAERLDGGLSELAFRGRALAPVFDLSYQSLDAPARHVFRMLGSYPGDDFTEHAAAALAGVTVAQARGILELLLDEHMLEQRAPGRYHLHDLVRAFARELGGEDPRTSAAEAIRRLATWCVHTSLNAQQLMHSTATGVPSHHGLPESPVPALHLATQEEGMAWFDLEHANLSAVYFRLAETGPSDLVAYFAYAVGWFLRTRGPFTEWREILLVAIAALEPDTDPTLAGRVYGNAGVACCHLGRFEEAIGYFRAALVLRRSAGDEAGVATVLVNLGGAYDELERAQEAVDCRLEALGHFTATGNREGVAVCLVNLAWSHRVMNQPATAVDYGNQALAAYRELGNDFGQAEALSGLGVFHLLLDRPEEAVPLFREALELRRRTGNRFGEADALNGLGDSYRQLDQPLLAQQAWRRAHEIYAEMHHPRAAEIAELLRP